MIPVDFGVEEITSYLGQTLFYKIDGCFHHFVLFDESRDYNVLTQTHYPRFELVSLLNKHLESSNQKNRYELSSGGKIEFTHGLSNLTICIFPNGTNISFDFLRNEDPVYTQIISDFKVYKSSQEEVKSSKVDDLISSIYDNPKIHKNSDKLDTNDLVNLCFEKQLNQGELGISFTNLYHGLLSDSIEDASDLLTLLKNEFEIIQNTQECNCGDEACFFDTMKKSQVEYLNGDYISEKGKYDFSLVKTDFLKLWTGLSYYQKTALSYLNYTFDNSTLFNLSFLLPDFDVLDYISKMCSPFQPDSENEQVIRKEITLVNYMVDCAKQAGFDELADLFNKERKARIK